MVLSIFQLIMALSLVSKKSIFYTPQITVTSVNLFSPDAGNECSKN